MFANCEPNSHVVQKMDGTARNKEICNVHYKIGGFGLYVWGGEDEKEVTKCICLGMVEGLSNFNPFL